MKRANPREGKVPPYIRVVLMLQPLAVNWRVGDKVKVMTASEFRRAYGRIDLGGLDEVKVKTTASIYLDREREVRTPIIPSPSIWGSLKNAYINHICQIQ